GGDGNDVEINAVSLMQLGAAACKGREFAQLIRRDNRKYVQVCCRTCEPIGGRHYESAAAVQLNFVFDSLVEILQECQPRLSKIRRHTTDGLARDWSGDSSAAPVSSGDRGASVSRLASSIRDTACPHARAVMAPISVRLQQAPQQ